MYSARYSTVVLRARLSFCITSSMRQPAANSLKAASFVSFGLLRDEPLTIGAADSEYDGNDDGAMSVAS